MGDWLNASYDGQADATVWSSPFDASPIDSAPVVEQAEPCAQCHAPIDEMAATAEAAEIAAEFSRITAPNAAPLPETAPELPERDEDIAALERAEQAYHAALEEDGLSAGRAFDALLRSAMTATRLQEHERRVAEAKEEVEGRKTASAMEWMRLNQSQYIVDVMSCHAGARLSELQLFGDMSTYDGLLRQQGAAEQQLAQLTAMKDAAFERFEALVRGAIVRSLPEGERDEVRIPAAALTAMADAMTGLGELKRAIDYKYAASMAAGRTSQRLWFGLDALWLEVVSGEKAPSEVMGRVIDLREHLPELFSEAMFYHAGGYPFAQAHELGRPLPIDDPGRPEDIRALSLKSWGVLYDIMQASLGELEDEDAIEARLSDIRLLEEERRQEVASRTGVADRFEAGLHLSNMERVMTAWTQRGGLLQHTRMAEDQEEAEKLHVRLGEDLAAMRTLADPFLEAVSGDRFYESFADMDWQHAFNGRRMLDRPQDGLRVLANNIIPAYPKSEAIASLLDQLRSEAQKLGIESHLFLGDALNPDIDIAELPAGITAGDRTRSAYWSSNSMLREAGLPMLSGGGCGLLALALWESGPGAILAGGACALATSVGNQQYNVRVLGGEAYRQSLATGLTNIDGEGAWRNKRVWLTMAGINTAFGAMPFTRTFVGGTGRLLFGGISRVGNSFARHYMAAAAERPFLMAFGRAVGGAAGDTVGSAGAAARWLGQRPPADLFHIGAGALYPLDYAFLDENYNLVPWDGRVDTAVGYAGAAAFWGGMAYRGFALTWREAAKYPVTTWRGAELLPFGEAVAQSNLRAGLIRAGADAAMTDYFLINDGPEGLEWIDFAAARETAREARDYDRQYKLDNWIGWGGLLAMGSDWAIHEWRSLPMYLESSTPFPWRSVARRPWTFFEEAWNSSSVAQARARIAIGNGLVGYDLVEDGHLNKWYYGGIGGSLLMNEAGHIMLEIDAMGSMVATGFRLGTEWLMQWQQDIPIRAPDAKRLMWASGESAIMRFPPKMYVMGHHYLKSFPLGRRIRAFHDWMNQPQRGYLTQFVGGNLRSIERMGGRPRLMPGQEAWRPKLIKPNAHKSIQLTLDAEGQPLAEPVRFHVLHQQRRWARNSSRPTRVSVGGREMLYEELANSASLKKLLKANGYLLNDGNLWQIQPWYIGRVRFNGQTMTAREYETMSAPERAEAARLLAKEGIYYKSFSEMKRTDPALYQRVRAHLVSENAWHDDLEGALMQRWYTDPAHPHILSSHGRYDGAQKSNGTFKITAIPFRRGLAAKVAGPGEEVWIRLDREFRPLAEARVGGWQVTMFKGPLNQPRLRAGILFQAPLMTGTAIGANYYIFRHTMDGDPEYQMMQRGFNYGVSELITHPVVQWPLGYDTAKAQFFGRTLGIFVNMAGNELFPTYLNTWPGMPTYYNRLDGVPDHPIGEFMEEHVASIVNGRPRQQPLDTWANTMSSSQVLPFGYWGTAEDSIALFESRGISTFRDAEACARALMEGEELLDEERCKQLPLKTQDALQIASAEWAARREARDIAVADQVRERNEKLAENFIDWMERERNGTISEMERRTLVIMAAHIQQTNREMALYPDEQMVSAYTSWRDLEKRYGDVLFKRLPSIRNDNDWSDFIRQVNGDRADASHFYFDLHAEEGEASTAP